MFRVVFLSPRSKRAVRTPVLAATASNHSQLSCLSFFSTAPATAAASPEPIFRLKLNMLQDNPGAIKQKRRKGRGIGSGRGKTCGHGHKGQKSRSGGKIHPLFNGGSTPYWKQFPKRGFNNTRHAAPHLPVNLRTIAEMIAMKRLDPNKPITLRALQLAGVFQAHRVKHGVKLLADGEHLLKRQQKLHIVVNRASQSAIAAVEARGGRVVTVHHNRLALRTVLRPQKFLDRLVPKHARPPPKYQPYYTSWNQRGYLNPAVQMREWFARLRRADDSDSGKSELDVAALEEKFGQLMLQNDNEEEEEETRKEEDRRKNKNKRDKKTSSKDEW